MAKKYIDAEELKAEIAQLKEIYLSSQDVFKFWYRGDRDFFMFYNGKTNMCGEILNIIDTLQQDETQVDKEKPSILNNAD